jgi:hypothetical protein
MLEGTRLAGGVEAHLRFEAVEEDHFPAQTLEAKEVL